ncbi:unnamed protein product [Brachionus calyciflorus]|uniref:DNA-dependent protein kinase catalytic subunit CC3 domain-containing protein n=1 Tax=Brachionus calyciflorus TaxID=104777 RepID=A0A814MV17_9BILA|nr:unnamed protein product [Brachionus calyciflorus]
MTLDPTNLGFSLKDMEVFSNLAQKIRGFFRIVIQNLLAPSQEFLKLQCSTILDENKDLNLKYINLNNIDWANLSQLVTGYEIINEFKIFKITFDLTRLDINYIYQNWSVFQPFWSNDIDTKLLLLNLLTKCLLIESVQANENKVSEMFFSFFVDEKLKLNFNCKLLDLSHFFTQMSQFKLAITQFLTQLPLKSMSLTKGDDDYTEYVNAVQILLVCLELSQSVDLLGGLIGIVSQRKTKFISLRSEFRDTKIEAKNRQINKINTLHSSNSSNQASYLSTQNNYTSSLSEELSFFDFNSHGSYSQSVNFQSNLSKSSSFRRSLTDDLDNQIQDIEIELDELNSHESKESLVSLFQSLISNKIIPVYENGQIPTEMPPLMSFLHKKILDVYIHENVKLFIIRAIKNTSNIFKPFCKFWFPSLIGFLVNSTLCREFDEMENFTLDLMILILSWCSIQKPEVTESKLINKLFGLLIKRCYHSNRAVLKNNLELIKTMTECWKEMILVPTSVK